MIKTLLYTYEKRDLLKKKFLNKLDSIWGNWYICHRLLREFSAFVCLFGGRNVGNDCCCWLFGEIIFCLRQIWGGLKTNNLSLWMIKHLKRLRNPFKFLIDGTNIKFCMHLSHIGKSCLPSDRQSLLEHSSWFRHLCSISLCLPVTPQITLVWTVIPGWQLLTLTSSAYTGQSDSRLAVFNHRRL